MGERSLPAWLWALVIASVTIVGFVLAAGVGSAGRDVTEVSPRSHGPVVLALWGLTTGGTFVVIGRVARGRHARHIAVGVLIALLATGAGAAVEATMMAWAAARFGAQAADPDLIGPSTALGAMTVLVGLTMLAGLALPASARGAASVMATVSAVGVLVVVALNVPGARDGITALGIPMAMAMVAASATTLASIGVVLRPRGAGSAETAQDQGQDPER